MTVHFSSKSNEWETPQDLFDRLNEKYNFTLDPCALPETAKCEKYYTPEDNGLEQDWSGEVVFMNPPYGRGKNGIPAWMKKAYEESRKGAIVVCLIPARTDTKWWHNYAKKGDITFLQGRVKFGGAKNGAPFPSVIVVFKRKRWWML